MKIVFLDRDGVINKFPGHGNYVTKVKDFQILPGVLEGIKRLNNLGYHIFVISNQAGVGRGLYSKDKLRRINNKMMAQLKRAEAKIKKVSYCIHRKEEDCDCRKPKTGAIERSLKLLRIKHRHITSGFFIGDAEMDILAGKNAKLKTILVLCGKTTRADLKKWKIKPDFIAKNLLDAVKLIEKMNSKRRYPRI